MAHWELLSQIRKTAVLDIVRQRGTDVTVTLHDGIHEHGEYAEIICNVNWPASSVSIATELRAGRTGIESRWGRDFPPVQTDPGDHPASCKMGTGSFPGGKVRPGRAADHSPPSSADVMEE